MADIKKRIIRTYTGITIFPYKKGSNHSLEKMTSISRFPRKGRDAYTGYFVKPKTFACRPMSLEVLQNGFPKYEIISASPYREDWIRPFSFSDDIEFTPIQLSFIEQMMRLTSNRVFCNLQTGFGKTFIMLYMISQIRKKTIVFCYSTTVLEQWMLSLKNHTNFIMSRSLLIQSSSSLCKIISGELNISEIDIFFCTPVLIGRYASQYGWSKVSELFEKMHIGTKVFDEAHRNIKMMTLIDSFTNVKRNYYLSADYSQSNPEKSKQYFQYFFDAPIIQVSKDVEFEMRYINALLVNFHSHPTELEKMQVLRPKYGFSNFEYMKYQFTKTFLIDTLDQVIHSIVQNNGSGKKILIATSMIDHVVKIYNHLKNIYPTYNPAPFYSELSDDEKEYAKKESSMIIATIGSFGPGVDVKGIQYVIALDQFDYITDNQLSGRARPDHGKPAFYIILNDSGFEYCNEKIRRRLGYLSRNKLNKISKVEIDME